MRQRSDLRAMSTQPTSWDEEAVRVRCRKSVETCEAFFAKGIAASAPPPPKGRSMICALPNTKCGSICCPPIAFHHATYCLPNCRGCSRSLWFPRRCPVAQTGISTARSRHRDGDRAFDDEYVSLLRPL